jgi:hypothetical protein
LYGFGGVVDGKYGVKRRKKNNKKKKTVEKKKSGNLLKRAQKNFEHDPMKNFFA